jgi:flagellin-like protein
MAFTKNDEAVSPVIGVILMVAITVILAAVIAAFVFGMAGNIQKTHVVSVTLTRASPTSVNALFQGGQDASALTNVSFTVDGAPDKGWFANAGVNSNPPSVIAIGCTTAIATTTSPSHIIGIATFNDGSKQIVIDTTI